MAGQSGATLLAGLDAKLSFTRIFYFFYFLTLLRRLFTPRTIIYPYSSTNTYLCTWALIVRFSVVPVVSNFLSA